MAAPSLSPMEFAVNRCKPEMIVPAQPTPYEVKNLSDVDNQVGHRLLMQVILFYPNVMGKKGVDPVKVIREAISKALVYYYPFAGRLREGRNGELTVECTGEGVMFIEADAAVRLEQFGDVIQPPFPCVDELLYNVPGSDGLINSPLLLIQVTRLLCGGFIVGIRSDHMMSDGIGLAQFLKAVTEMVPGARVPSVRPVWERHLLTARDPPRVSCVHPLYHDLSGGKGTPLAEVHNKSTLVLRCFFFGSREMKALRNQLAPHLRNCSQFELLTACMWRCRTISLGLDPDENVYLWFAVNARTKLSPPLPVGYYGNAIGITAAVSTVAKICNNPLGYTVKLVNDAKAAVTDEYMRSFMDVSVQKGRPLYFGKHTYMVVQVGFNEIDFGWGKPLYGGPTLENFDTSVLAPSMNNKGEDGFLGTVKLATDSMKVFEREFQKLFSLSAL